MTTTGEPDAGKARLSGSGRGRRKRTQATGTSPAAYFTLWGAAGETPAAYPAAIRSLGVITAGAGKVELLSNVLGCGSRRVTGDHAARVNSFR